MNKAIFALALIVTAQLASAADTSKDGADMIYAEAVPLSKVPAIVDDDGCLWLIAKKDHKLMSVAILDQARKQICRPAK
ncbi:hypothetical protein A9R05_41860 (plasmid) [Burkholderia sp. KK1]|uniref:hypothetical protein n=1 Tax=Burkholderia sp. M701 TaxID=326454 RepID=UPI0009799801|nr:hypothetical protein [Burkholderia sp. M701]AQH05572.1 hypothetical protein A9R05_41860 [Burkholderia sp. KK1]